MYMRSDERIYDVADIAVFSTSIADFKARVIEQLNTKGAITFYGKYFQEWDDRFLSILEDYSIYY
jgi:hypothetical protein